MIAVTDLHARYRDKNVLVTGGNGFLGQHVCTKLKQLGAKVIAPKSKDYDLTHRRHTEKLFRMIGPVDYIFHLAGHISGIQANHTNPIDHLDINARMALNVLGCARAMDATIVAAGSVCSYPGEAAIPMREDQFWDGYPEVTNAPYGIAKRMMYALMWAMNSEYDTRCAYLISANLYGPGDHFDTKRSHVVPALVRKFVTAADTGAPKVEVWGDGTATRDFLYVKDAANAYILAGYYAENNDYIVANIGSEMEVKIGWLAELIAKAAGFEGEIVYDESKLTGQKRRLLDCSIAHNLLDWYARTNIVKGIQKTVEWYKEFEYARPSND